MGQLLKLTAAFSLIIASMPLLGQAQSTPSADTINIAKQKYQIAQSVYQASQKCSDQKNMNINDVVIAATKLSAKDYGEFLTTHGHSQFVKGIDNNLSNGLKRISCNTLRQNAEVKSYIANTSLLVNEMLYAISLSELTECGELSKSSMTKVMAEAHKIAATMSQRPDYANVKPMAKNRGKHLAELCIGTGMFAGDYLFMSSDPMGDVLVEMTKFMTPN